MKYETNLSHSMNVLEKYKANTVEENQAIAKSLTKNFAAATFNLKGDLNLGSIIRTAHLTGARDFFILSHRKWDRRSSVGTHHYINVEKHDECIDWKTTEDMIISKGYSPIVVEHGGMLLSEWIPFVTQHAYEQAKGLPPCFIFGPEEGFGPDWPAHISLEQMGVSRSYNVSAAAAIVLYNWSFR